MKMKYRLLRVFGIALTFLVPLCIPLSASEDYTQVKIDQNISTQQEKLLNNRNEVGIPKKIESFFGGVLDDVREFLDDNHIINSEK